jgi:tetratricopeptide (TPR) repeat protein
MAATRGSTGATTWPTSHRCSSADLRAAWCRAFQLIVIAAGVSAACGGRPPVAASPDARPAADVGADALIRQGCYRCLERAFEEAQTRSATAQAFEAAALLALRSKELGLPADAWLDRARTLAGSDAEKSTYVDIVDTIPPDRLSESREALFDFAQRRRAREMLTTWRDTLHDGGGSDVFRAHLDVSLVCAFGTLTETPESFTGSVDPAMMTPLVQYAIGSCDVTQRDRLSTLRAAHPDFVDADLALGRYALEDPARPDPEEALRRLQSAAEAFPRSPAITTRIGNLYRAWEDWVPALAAFDAALSVAPDHPEATIGRAISLSYLGRSEEAIETTTRLIDQGQWLQGEARYWRAWNDLRLERYELARADADRARTLMSNAAVMVLSGVIDWRLGRLDGAERDFQNALAIDLGECEAAFNLGVVRDQLKKLREAHAAFTQAGQCYDLSIAVRREAIQTIRNGQGTETLKARESARHERVLADLEERRRDVTRIVEGLEKAGLPGV